MNEQEVLDLLQSAFSSGLMLSMPVMLATLVVGILISILQSITSIQEQTMVFVPKIITMFITLLILFSWMMNHIVTFTQTLFGDIPTMIQ